mmetsp:Transcript_56948/g.133549  ORF Transcript_56948/g.133549 Transcript_56948/m.133549 type:complete len:310 (-) Transcript_56948:83-1012(-)
MDRDGALVDALDVGPEVLDQRLELRRRRVPDRVRHVQRRSTSLDGDGVKLREERRVGPKGVLSAELDVLDQRRRVRHHLFGDRQNLRPGLLELVLHVDVAGGDEGVDARELGTLDRLRTALDIRLGRTCEAADDRGVLLTPDRVCNLLHCEKIIRRSDRESSLDHVDAQAVQLLSNLELLLAGHAAPRALLSVTQRRVEHLHSARIPPCRNVVLCRLRVNRPHLRHHVRPQRRRGRHTPSSSLKRKSRKAKRVGGREGRGGGRATRERQGIQRWREGRGGGEEEREEEHRGRGREDTSHHHRDNNSSRG